MTTRSACVKTTAGSGPEDALREAVRRQRQALRLLAIRLCKACHDSLRSTEARAAVQSAFRACQTAVKQYLARRHMSLLERGA